MNSKIKNTFKNLLIENLNQAKPLRYDQLIDQTAYILEAEDFPHDILWNWFEQIAQNKYLTDFFNSEIREIIVHSNQLIETIESNTNKFHSVNDLSQDDYQLSLEILCASNNISWNYSHPFASFFYHQGDQKYRISLIHHSTSPNKISKLYARRIASHCFSLKQFNIPQALENSLENHVLKKSNIIISGSTGSGKTAFMSSLIQKIPSQEHVVIMEDTHEIQSNHDNHTLMLSQEGLLEKTLKSYCSYALRMSPSRLILGEIRSNEIVPFILSMNTGHKGLISTVHANSAYDAISRLAVLFCLFSEQKEISYQLILKLICTNIDIIIQMEECKIKEIIHVIGSDNEQPIFEHEYH